MIPACAGVGGPPSANGATVRTRGARRMSESSQPGARVIVPQAPPARTRGTWMGTLAGLAAGALIARLLLGAFGQARGDMDAGFGLLGVLLGGCSMIVVLMFFRRREAACAQPGRPVLPVSASVETPSKTTRHHSSDDSSFDRGVRDIRRADPGFDPTRFAGYAGMVFRAAQGAWMTRDVASLRDRITPELYVDLQAQSDRLLHTGHANRVERIDITAEITEAWQESGRDYVTAYIGGSIVDYTVAASDDSVVQGSRTLPREMEEFWTFTRATGLNSWMLSAIHSS
jgi:predicted lipid-binding transport protein (Tim44 family)